MTRNDIVNLMGSLAGRRPVFHSEADFQHELARELALAGYQCRLEVPTTISLNGSSGLRAEIDILIQPSEEVSERTVIELKYVTRKRVIHEGGEVFNLGGSWGTNLSRFDCLADLQRVGAMMRSSPLNPTHGFTIFLTNAEEAWAKNVLGASIMAANFSIHHGRNLVSGSSLDWNPPSPSDKSVNMKRLHPYCPIHIHRNQTCDWEDYSLLKNNKGKDEKFRYLVLEG